MRSRPGLWASVVALAVVAGTTWGAWSWVSREHARDEGANAAVAAYIAGWNAKDMSRVAFDQTGAAADFTATISGLGATPVRASAAEVDRSGTTAMTRVTVEWTLPGDKQWSYAVPLTAAERNGTWVVTAPATGSRWHPQLPAGATLALSTVEPKRGEIYDRGGASLMPVQSVYPVQIDPARATPESVAGLEAVTGEAPGSLVARLAEAQAAGSAAPIPVITYRQADFDARREQLDALVGVIYPRSEQPLALSRTFGQPLLGTFGPVTAELVEASNGRYVAGDRAGLSGLQRQYDTELAGSPGLQVVASTGKVLYEEAAVQGTDLTTTLSPAVQAAAESALNAAAAGGSGPAALVALDVPSGEVLAVANSPADGMNRALTGHYAPGSGFKIVSTHTLLSKGMVTPETAVGCPATITVDGRTFRNYAGEESAESVFLQDFAHSCNTAFISLTGTLAAGDLPASAKALGLGDAWAARIGVADTFVGSVPDTTPGTDLAAATIGQGRIEASPLSMAVVAGSVARGAYLPPTLVKAGPGAMSTQAMSLDPTVIDTLRTLMRAVVTEGSGTALLGAPGGDVYGKTGTAEYGTETPPKTHAWFVGYQGDLAFAVLVEDGRSGGSVAAPIARTFLDAYHAAPTDTSP